MATFILAFDHRSSFVRSFLEVAGEPSEDDVRVAADVKSLIAEGLLAAILHRRVPVSEAAALVDATYGAAAIERLRDAGVRVAVPVEASGRREFAFEHADWRERLDALHPTWAKVLVRYNPSVDAEMNERQRSRLLDVQTVARAIGVGFLFELLVPPGTGAAHGGLRHRDPAGARGRGAGGAPRGRHRARDVEDRGTRAPRGL